MDVKTRLPDSLLFQQEKLTKIHGVALESPFIDITLFEWLASLHELLAEKDWPFKPYTLLSNQPVSPPRHFTVPRWIKQHPEMHRYFQLLRKGTLIDTGLISEKWLKEQVETPYDCQMNFDFLWGLLILEIWLQMFTNTAISKELPDLNI